MKRNKLIRWGLVGVLIVLGGLVGVNNFKKEVVEEKAVYVEEKEQAEVVIDFGDGRVVEDKVGDQEGATVYELLELVTSFRELKIDAVQYDFGVFVKGIDGIESNNEKAWIYFVNGEAGTVAADQVVVQSGDKIEWKYIMPTEN